MKQIDVKIRSRVTIEIYADLWFHSKGSSQDVIEFGEHQDQKVKE